MEVVVDFITPNQSTFIPSRFISDNNLLSLQMKYYMVLEEPKHLSSYCLSVDLKKAFDTV